MARYGLDYCLLLRPNQKSGGMEEHHPRAMKAFGMKVADL
jgi:hypothetical protein